MNYTENYNLKKPDKTDYININDINVNMDIVDSILKAVSDRISEISTGLGDTGYIYIGNLLLQWGKATVNCTGAGIELIEFPKKYDIFYNVQATKTDSSEYSFDYVVPTTTGLQVGYQTQGSSTAQFVINWFTIGKAPDLNSEEA